MLKCFVITLLLGIAFVSSQNWESNSHVLEAEAYFTKVIQEMIYELERREWCNLKLDNIYQTINDSLFNWVVNGTVIYQDGFLVSIEKMDITNMMNSLFRRTVDGVDTTFANVQGRINLRDTKVGFDVLANLTDIGFQRSTGVYNYVLIQYFFSIDRNLMSGDTTVSSTLMSLNAGSGVRMIYFPASNVTEALSRRWVASNNWNSIGAWGTSTMAPIILNVTSTLPFPDICIGCYA